MPKVNRKYYISSFLHIMVQGINKENIFEDEDNKKMYLKLIVDKAKNFNINVLAYAIMDNHAHILIHYYEINDVSKMMQVINTKYAKFYNRSENRVGYVFRDRYKAEQIKDENHLSNVLPYIHYNPVKANIVKKPENYKFSSYNYYIHNQLNNKKAYILFKTYDYIDIFKEIHRNYFEKRLIIDKEKHKLETQDVIEKMKQKYHIENIKTIIKEKNLLLELILQLEEKTKLKDYEIAKVLNIGKNRIYLLKKQLVDKK